MPEFYDVVRHFDDTPTTEGYTGEFLFNGQYTTFNETSLEGSITKRRTMSVAPGTVMPARRVIALSGEKWIVGDGNTDAFMGQDVRANYWLKKATDLATLCTPLEVLSSVKVGDQWTVPGKPVYVNLEYRKDTVDTLSTSDYDAFWDIYSSPSEGVRRGNFFLIRGELYRAREAHLEINGLTLAGSDQMDGGALTEVVIGTKVYDPVEQEWVGTDTTVVGVVYDYFMNYRFITQADYENVKGDRGLYLASQLAVGSKLNVQNVDWVVLAVTPENGAYVHHIRRA